MDDASDSIKVVLVGETGVGKTSIIMQFVDESFQKDQQSTTGGTFSIKTGKCDNGKTIKFEIWDTAGQEKYRSLTKLFYKDVNAAVMVYDITRKQTFEELKNYWTEQIKENGLSDTFIAIAANKSDLSDQEQVEEEDARAYAKSIDAIFMSTSAKNAQTVQNLFTELGKKFMKCGNITYPTEEEPDQTPGKKRSDTQKLGTGGQKKKKGFC
jgi:small GTP-binding protein